MTNIEMKLKSREQLSMEILTLQQKLMLKDKEIERLGNELQVQIEDNARLNEYIERLNNIINELEKWLKDYINLFKEPDIYEEQTLEDLKEVLDKLQELKGSDKK